MQRRYYTLADDRFDLDTLTTDEVLTIDEVLKIDEATKAEPRAASDEEYLKCARKLIRENFPTFAASNRALSGAVGSVYRDRWYRRQLFRAGEGSPDANRLLTNIRVHPGRVIHDVFLDSDISQADFARQIGVSRSVMSRLVSLFSVPANDRRSEEPLSTTTLVAVLSRLGVASRSLYVDEPSTRTNEPSERLAAPITFRECLLLNAVIEGVRQIGQRNAEPFARRLSRLFNTVDVQFIDSIVKSLLRALGRGRWSDPGYEHFEIAKVLSTVSREQFLENIQSGESRSNRLFQQWVHASWGGQAVSEVLESEVTSVPTSRNSAPQHIASSLTKAVLLDESSGGKVVTFFDRRVGPTQTARSR